MKNVTSFHWYGLGSVHRPGWFAFTKPIAATAAVSWAAEDAHDAKRRVSPDRVVRIRFGVHFLLSNGLFGDIGVTRVYS